MVKIITKFFRPTWLKAWINEPLRYQSIGQLLLKIGIQKKIAGIYLPSLQTKVYVAERTLLKGVGKVL
jgi:hypothetical protein